MSADFTPIINPQPDTPNRGNYTDLQPFRFWCQKVLPLVYDESLSYYELLCKVVDYLNKTMEDVGTLNDDIGALYGSFDDLKSWTSDQIDLLLEAYNELQGYVNDYFDNLDVQQEINNKLDALVTDGTMTALVAPFVPSAVDAWLDASGITQETGYVLDPTLTSAGAAAPAKTVGDKFTEVKGALDSDLSAVSDTVQINKLYDEIHNTSLTDHNGVDNKFYTLNKEIYPAKIICLRVYMYASGTLKVLLIGKTTKKILKVESLTANSGENAFIINNSFNESCYLSVDASADKICYDVSGTMSYSYDTITNQTVGTIVNYNFNSTAGFRISIYSYIDVYELESETENNKENLNDVSIAVDSLTKPYLSEQFEYNENATPIDAFLLDQIAPVSGNIKKINFASGVNRNGIQITVYDWDGTTISQSAITVIDRYTVNIVNGIATCNIPIEKGQFIGVSLYASVSCKWYENSSGAGFVYLPEGSGITYFPNKYITLSYELYSTDYIGSKNTNLLDGSIILLAGDSRSSTDYTFYKSTMEKKTNAVTLPLGASGENAAYNASNSYFAVISNNPHDFSIWLVGGNDPGVSGSIGTFNASSPLGQMGESVVTETDITEDYDGTTFIQAIDHIQRKYKSLFYDFKTLNNGHKPKMIFCTDLPQQRENASSYWSRPENWERKRLAIIECCEKNNIACLDLFKLCNFDMSYEPFWTSPTDFDTDSGIYYMDGLHPNQYGDDIITSLEIAEIQKYIMVNPYPEAND